MEIGTRIRQGRRAAGLSQSQVAQGLGIDQTSVSAWERGGAGPRAEQVIPLAELLKVDPLWLLTGSGRGPAAAGVEAA